MKLPICCDLELSSREPLPGVIWGNLPGFSRIFAQFLPALGERVFACIGIAKETRKLARAAASGENFYRELVCTPPLASFPACMKEILLLV